MSNISLWHNQERLPLEKLKQAIDALLLPFGGLEDLIYPGESVFLKPSIGSENIRQGDFTSLALTEAVIILCHEAGAGKIIIGDSSENGKDDMEDKFLLSGYRALANRTGVELLDLAKTPVVKRSSPENLFYDEISVYQKPLQADILINLPQLRRTSEGFWGAIDNLQGLLPYEERSHLQKGSYSRGILDVYSLIQPQLTIVDAMIAWDINRTCRGNAVFAGMDIFSIDTILSAMWGYDPLELQYLLLANQYGLGTVEAMDISIFGDDLLPVMENFADEI